MKLSLLLYHLSQQGRGWYLVVSAVFKTVGCNLLQRQVRFLPLPNKKNHDHTGTVSTYTPGRKAPLQ